VLYIVYVCNRLQIPEVTPQSNILVNRLCGQIAEILNVSYCGTEPNHGALKGSDDLLLTYVCL